VTLTEIDSGVGHETGPRGLSWGVSSGIPDRDLVLLLRRRQPGAFEELYRRYRDRIWRFLARLAGRVDIAEDLFQDTWLAAARNAHRLREDTELGPWLFTIARNKYRNGLRFVSFDERKRTNLSTSEQPTPSSPDHDAVVRQQIANLAASFDRLPSANREVLLLALVEGLETGEIAAILGLREDAVRKRLSRARAALTSSMQEVEGDNECA
jgi:RNA polymerase sigma factor (sigma-70 family)